MISGIVEYFVVALPVGKISPQKFHANVELPQSYYHYKTGLTY